MFEIELKAHVQDPESVRHRLSSFARFLGRVDKQDLYLKQKGGPRGAIQVRIRKETRYGDEETAEVRYLVTYKQKEVRTEGAVPIEVNREIEFTVSDGEAFQVFLEDAAFDRAYNKRKIVEQWDAGTVMGQAAVELCEVPPLGFFLEIEILASRNDQATVDAARGELKKLLLRAGVPLCAIEGRYYSELLTATDRHLSTP